MNRVFLLIALVLVISGCNSKPTEVKVKTKPLTSWNPPHAGIVVDKYEEKIEEDKLNNAYFKVILTSTDSSKAGHYLVQLEKGVFVNKTDVDLPKWTNGVVLKPILKKGEKPYQCLLGFDVGDGNFKDFYLIKLNEKGDIVMKQTVGYYK
jgi:hypothetical protein